MKQEPAIQSDEQVLDREQTHRAALLFSDRVRLDLLLDDDFDDEEHPEESSATGE